MVSAPLQPILHPSLWRLRWLGLFTLVGHPLFHLIWGVWLPQPYENTLMRFGLSLSGVALMASPVCRDPTSKLANSVFTAVFWVQLPLFFSWMYLCNGGNTVWLASFCAMILIYYAVTDWRIATAGILIGGLLAAQLFAWFGPAGGGVPLAEIPVNAVVIAFSWASALLLGLSSADLRREHLKHTLTTMGIMAHELRTPLATMSLIGDAMRGEVRAPASGEEPSQLDKLAQRLHVLVRNMNHQIDMQMTNARLNRLPGRKETVSAANVVQQVVQNYPYRSTRERECVVLHVRRDFLFQSSPTLFAQVIDNLLKNALKALAATSTPAQPGDLMIEIGVLQNRGRIIVSDHGIGIDPQLQPRVFEAFFSTDSGSGHGLGLAFCKRVVQGARGTIRVNSEPGKGATFTIELPLFR